MCTEPGAHEAQDERAVTAVSETQPAIPAAPATAHGSAPSPSAMAQKARVRTPIEVTGFKPTASLTVDSTTTDPTKLASFELLLYGDTGTEPAMPTPDEIAALFAA